MVATNSLNINSSGVVVFDSTTGVFAESALTQYNVLVGGASNAITSIGVGTTAGVPLISGGAGVNPSFGTALVAGGGTGLTTLSTYQLLAGGTTSTGNLQQVGIGSAGQVLTSNGAGALPTFQTAASGLSWVSVTSGSQTIAVNTGYITNNAGTVTYTLPTTAAQGTIFEITGGASAAATVPWTIDQNAGQTITLGSSTTTAGVSGALGSTLKYDSIRLLCVVANTAWVALSSVGNFTVI